MFHWIFIGVVTIVVLSFVYMVWKDKQDLKSIQRVIDDAWAIATPEQKLEIIKILTPKIVYSRQKRTTILEDLTVPELICHGVVGSLGYIIADHYMEK